MRFGIYSILKSRKIIVEYCKINHYNFLQRIPRIRKGVMLYRVIKINKYGRTLSFGDHRTSNLWILGFSCVRGDPYENYLRNWCAYIGCCHMGNFRVTKGAICFKWIFTTFIRNRRTRFSDPSIIFYGQATTLLHLRVHCPNKSRINENLGPIKTKNSLHSQRIAGCFW